MNPSKPHLITRLVVSSVLMLCLLGGGLWTGYQLGVSEVGSGAEETTAQLRVLLEKELSRVEEAREYSRDHLNAMARRVGLLQAHVLRLNALGERLAVVADLDEREFNFDGPPPRGGPVLGEATESPVSLQELHVRLLDLAASLDDRERKLDLLEELLMDRNVLADTRPGGRPIENGWLSSGFGKRTDPFTGDEEFHRGIDFAGKAGSAVVAVASGVVSRVERVSGYGRLIEINHGNGYRTRYGHNKEILVKVGDTVDKGQKIATMGSSGRATGPHVHFEVIRNGKIVNPTRYVQASR